MLHANGLAGAALDPDDPRLSGSGIASVVAGHEMYAAVATDELVFGVVTALRRHPHVSNVLTHISGQSWPRIEQAIRLILDPATRRADLTPLGHNIVDLMVTERGVTGRIFKPFLWQLLVALTGPHVASEIVARIGRLAAAD